MHLAGPTYLKASFFIQMKTIIKYYKEFCKKRTVEFREEKFKLRV